MAKVDVTTIPTISKAEAREQGEPRYFLKKPCKRGHTAWRFTSTGQCSACQNEHGRRYVADNPQRLEQSRARYAKDRERRLELQRVRRATCEKHKARNRCRARLNKARRHGAPGAHTPAQERALLNTQAYRCKYCGVGLSSKWQADHFMPLILGGSNDIDNIRITCVDCNQRKNKTHPLIWMLKNKAMFEARNAHAVQGYV